MRNHKVLKNLHITKRSKDVREMLGLTTYCCKFILASADIIRLLTQLTHMSPIYIWETLMKVQFCFIKIPKNHIPCSLICPSVPSLQC